MQGLLDTVESWHVHPVADHFTVSIIILAVLTDLIASLFSTRLWLRYAALALIIVGTIAAWCSKLTGGWEAHHVWQAVKAAGGPAYATLDRHADLGDYLPWVFLVLALWRIGAQLFGFMAGTRGLYLIFALLAAIAIIYQGYLGGELVYQYGIGTALYAASPTAPVAQPEATGPATPIPTVYVPTAAATPEAASPSATASPATPVAGASAATNIGSATPEPTSATSTSSPSASPTPVPSGTT